MIAQNQFKIIKSLQRNGYEDITVADPSNVNQKELERANIKFVADSKGLGTEADVLFTGMFQSFLEH